MAVTSTEPAERTFHTENIGGPFDDAHVGVCDVCGHRTKRKGSPRKASAAIADHAATHTN